MWRTFRQHSRRLWWPLLGVCLLLGGAVALAHLVPLPERLNARPSVVVEYRDGSPAHVFLAEDDRWRVPVTLDTLDPAYVRALLALEDARFRWHPGVDPLAVVRSAWLNLSSGRRVSGASTLTMQLVRVLEPRPRTWGSKLVEALRAVQLELRLSKDEILTAYLQFVPYGRNFEGVQTASLAYFGHGADALSAEEIATLLAVPQSPSARFPHPANLSRLKQARDGIASRLAGADALPVKADRGETDPQQVLAQVEAAAVPASLQPFPRQAPHAARWFLAQRPGEVRLRTTLDAGMQRLAEDVMRRAAGEARTKGIHNGAAIILEHRTGALRALVGNFDDWAEGPGAQINAFATPRSPGSTLKPLLYALAIDRGIAGPEHLVSDIPQLYGTYAPRNYDGGFEGLVRLEAALSRSLNLPFVELQRKLGTETFIAQLRAQGARSLDTTPGHYGLSASIGGIELTPLELASIYAVLGQRGREVRVHGFPDEAEERPRTAPRRFYAEGAGWLTQQALALRDRPDFPERRRMSGAAAHIHWKTGTSFGHRDAWSVGSGPVHTAVVWMGNLDNRGSVHLTGASMGPLLFDLLEGVADRSLPPPSPSAPPDLTRVEVCAYSGHLPTKACRSRRQAWALSSAVPVQPCPFHREVTVDRHTGLQLTPRCRAGREWETRQVLAWPASIRRWLHDQRRVLEELPPYAPGCEPTQGSDAPIIVSPASGQVALLLPGVEPEKQAIPLEAEAPGSVGELSWFVNGEYLGTSRADERLWWTPKEGVHEILVSTSTGRSDRRRLEVRTRR